MAKVLFQSVAPQLFRASSIGSLYEIAQQHQVMLITRKLDARTEEILHDKNLFPGLENVIYFEWPFHGGIGDIFHKNYRACKIVKNAIEEYAPDIVIAQTDIWPPDLYLLRAARKKGIVTAVIQSGFKIAEQKKLYHWSCLMNAHLNMPHALPFFVRLFLVIVKKYIGHFFYYWILPLGAGEMPFWGKASFIFWYESAGLRDADYTAVFSKRDYDICINDGVKPEKLLVIGHPLEHASTRGFFQKAYFSQHRERIDPKTLVIMWPDEAVGFQNRGYALIPGESIRESRVKIVNLISKKLDDWKIVVKPHPAIKEASIVKAYLGEISNNVFIANPLEPADTYIEMSRVIVGMPHPSTTLFTASKQNPEKIVVFLHLNNEFLGDSYKDFPGIEYIETEERFKQVLDGLRKGTYEKQQHSAEPFDFENASDLVDGIIQKSKTT